jgi:hypothetical protein
VTKIVAMALDQSPNHTGWAIGRPCDFKPLFGKFALPSWGDDEPDRLFDFFNWLNSKIKENGVTHLFCELPVPAAGKGFAQIYTPTRGKNAGQTRARVVNSKDPDIAENQNMMTGIIYVCSRLHGISVAPIDVGDMRQRFIGCRSIPGLQGEAHRNELKLRAVRACAMRGYIVEDHNVAEAIGHLDLALSFLDPRGHGMKSSVSARRTELNLWNGSGL